MLTVLGEQWQTNAWVNYKRDTYTYDANGNMLTELEEYWQGSWVNSERWTYTYDANGNMLTRLDEQWQTNAWVNYYRWTYTYDANGNSITGKSEEWQGNWQPALDYLPGFTPHFIHYIKKTRHALLFRFFCFSL